MSDKNFDPLSALFSGAQLSGLSGVANKPSTQKPLDIDFDQLDSAQNSSHKPKRPPRPQDDIAEEELLEIEEESSSEEPPNLEEAPKAEEPVQPTPQKPAVDPEIALQMLLAKQALEKEKKRRAREQAESDAKQKSQAEKKRKEEEAKRLKDRLTNLSTPQKKSAMDIFLQAVEESEQPKQTKSASSAIKKAAIAPKTVPKVQPVLSEQPVAAKPMMGNTLSLSVSSLIKNNLPSLAEFHVASAMDSFNRPQLKAMWMSKRTLFLSKGQLEYAVAAASVIDALKTVDDGNLIAAYVETTASDYLIWVDREHNRLIAAFANAGEYFA